MARTEILCKGNVRVVCVLIKMRILVSKEILREAAKTEQLVENAESKKYALNPFGKACFFLLYHV